MENPRTLDPEQGARDGICPRCGGSAEWILADKDQTHVEVTCPDCGKFQMLRAEFDQVESEIVEPEER